MAPALFANQRETNLQSTIALVEEVLTELGYPPAAARISDPSALHAWQIVKGSATTRVLLVDAPDFTHLRVVSTVMTVDDSVDRPALYVFLLDLNASLCGAAFATQGDRVLLLGERSTLDLDRSEVMDLIKRITTAADDHDDRLVAAFGGRLGG